MEKQDFIKAIEGARAGSKKRKFKQTYDLIINLKGINVKKAEEHIDFFMQLPYNIGKKVKVCGLVGPELGPAAKDVLELAIMHEEFVKYQGKKKEIKKLANGYDFFVAQANIMPKVAAIFGKVLGPKGKMPNPKAGCVVPPNANLKALYDKLQNTARISAKTQPTVQVAVGIEGMDDAQILDNIMSVYNQVIHHLPNEKNNIKNALLKLTMGKTAMVGGKAEKGKEEKKQEE